MERDRIWPGSFYRHAVWRINGCARAADGPNTTTGNGCLLLTIELTEFGFRAGETGTPNQFHTGRQSATGCSKTCTGSTERRNSVPSGHSSGSLRKGDRHRRVPTGRSGHCPGKAAANSIFSDQGRTDYRRGRCGGNRCGTFQRQSEPAAGAVSKARARISD